MAVPNYRTRTNSTPWKLSFFRFSGQFLNKKLRIKSIRIRNYELKCILYLNITIIGDYRWKHAYASKAQEVCHLIDIVLVFFNYDVSLPSFAVGYVSQVLWTVGVFLPHPWVILKRSIVNRFNPLNDYWVAGEIFRK